MADVTLTAIDCQRCDKTFTPKTQRARYCDNCRKKASRNTARDTSRALDRVKTCARCREVFSPRNKRKLICPGCEEAIRTHDLEFIGIDGEGMTRWCNHADCDCGQFVSGRSCKHAGCECKQFAPRDDGKCAACGHAEKYNSGKLPGHEHEKCAGCGHAENYKSDKLPGHEHAYVLLRCGDTEPIENLNGIQWHEAFAYLYGCFQLKPDAVFSGYYLGYDFIQIFKTLPWERARKLITPEGQAERKRNDGRGYLPVDLTAPDGTHWRAWWLENRMLTIEKCRASEHIRQGKCREPKISGAKRMYICDAGPFYQQSFLKAITRKQGQPQICSPEVLNLIREGKQRRSAAVLDNDMRLYNRLEVIAFADLMRELNRGFCQMGVMLGRNQWYGPGQVAADWLDTHKIPNRKSIEENIPAWFLEAARQSYFGGWFEIMAHGIIPGFTYEYDINSAYPYIIAKLPCLLHGRYTRGCYQTDRTPREKCKKPALPAGAIRLVRAEVTGDDPHIGAMLHRTVTVRICRPHKTAGWYWQHELDAGMRAGVIQKVEYREWVTYEPCDCLPPVRRIANEYQRRLAAGKDSPLGKALRLTYNSLYGKFAQTTGSAPCGNFVYASLITAGCREMILDAIATHPNRTKDVVMVATDAVYFLTPHPGLPQSSRLGDWEMQSHDNLVLIKPGVYYSNREKELKIKSRGVSPDDLKREIDRLETQFRSWGGRYPEAETGWPSITYPVDFTLRTCKQVLNVPSEYQAANGTRAKVPTKRRLAQQKDNWHKAGKVITDGLRTDSSYPGEKRAPGYFDAEHCIYRSRPKPGDTDRFGRIAESIPYDKSFSGRAMEERGEIDTLAAGIMPDGPMDMMINSVMGHGG